jgi:3-oxoacyl-[acyl-carrier protein] reductase
MARPRRRPRQQSGAKRAIIAPVEKTAIVIGGTRRIGRWCSEGLLAAGWRVHAFYRRHRAEADDFAAEMAQAGLPLSCWQADAEDAAELQRACAAALAGAPCGLLVNAAGPAYHGALSATPPEVFERLWRGNCLSVHNAVQAVLPAMSTGGRIVCFISAGNDGLKAYREVPAYAAAKSMLLSYCRSLARELAPRKVTVNCISLGVAALTPEGVPEIDAALLPSGRFVEQEDVVQALWQLAGDGAAQLTGSVLNLGGGFGL